jgi:hypothetical protein
MIAMVQEHLQENKPSQNDHFSHKVRFFLALKTKDMRQVETLVQRDPDLIHRRAMTTHGMARSGATEHSLIMIFMWQNDIKTHCGSYASQSAAA